VSAGKSIKLNVMITCIFPNRGLVGGLCALSIIAVILNFVGSVVDGAASSLVRRFVLLYVIGSYACLTYDTIYFLIAPVS
jgi:hypothetical protein